MSYCNKCKKNTKSLDEQIKKSKNNRFYSVSKCATCGIKKVRFVKDPKQGEGIIDNIKGFFKGIFGGTVDVKDVESAIEKHSSQFLTIDTSYKIEFKKY
jgi:hypothetical protein